MIDNAEKQASEIKIDQVAITINSQHIAYGKGDFTRICKVGDDFAFIVFQFPYNVIADKAEAKEPITIKDAIPIAKFILGNQSFKQLVTEVINICKKTGVEI